jgi:hypothetical protein
MRNGNIRLGLAVTITALVLAVQHWFPWWRKLRRLEAYTLGTAAVLAGQGVYLGFNRAWRKLALIAGLGGLVVFGAYLYDWCANQRARRTAGVVSFRGQRNSVPHW